MLRNTTADKHPQTRIAIRKNFGFIRKRLDSSDQDSLFQILHSISQCEVEQRISNQKADNRLSIRYLFFFIGFPAGLAAMLFGLAHLLNNAEWLLAPSLGALIIAYLGALAQPLAELFIHRKTVISTLRHPFGKILNNAEQTTSVDARFFPELLLQKLSILELVYLEIKSERDFFERRIAIVVGSIDKIGLAPGILAGLISITQLTNSGTKGFVLSLAYATPILYFFGAIAHNLVMRLDRMTKLLALAIAYKTKSEFPA